MIRRTLRRSVAILCGVVVFAFTSCVLDSASVEEQEQKIFWPFRGKVPRDNAWVAKQFVAAIPSTDIHDPGAVAEHLTQIFQKEINAERLTKSRVETVAVLSRATYEYVDLVMLKHAQILRETVGNEKTPTIDDYSEVYKKVKRAFAIPNSYLGELDFWTITQGLEKDLSYGEKLKAKNITLMRVWDLILKALSEPEDTCHIFEGLRISTFS